jgi:minor extracellular serine protease Vpr
VNAPAAGTLIGAEGALTAPLTAKGVTADVVYVGSASAGVSLLASPKGRIALADRDGRPFADKVKACQQAGAVGIMVINSSPSAPTTMSGDRTGVTIPGVMVGRDDGARLKAALAAGQKLNVTLSSQGMVASPDWADRIDDASSRGPRRGDGLIKPDVGAPGVNIVSACAGSGDRGIPQTGTSAAAPVVAGIAALLRQLHPTWSVAEVKAAIMNTAAPVAADGVPYPISRQGAGRVRADAAATVDCLAIADDGAPSLSFGFVDEIEGWADRQLTLTNKGSETRDFTMKVDAMTAVDGSNGVQLTVTLPDDTETHLTLAPGASVTLDVTLAVNPELMSADIAEYGGSLTFTETTGTGQVLRVPFLAAIRTGTAQINSLANRRTFLPNGGSAG